MQADAEGVRGPSRPTPTFDKLEHSATTRIGHATDNPWPAVRTQPDDREANLPLGCRPEMHAWGAGSQPACNKGCPARDLVGAGRRAKEAPEGGRAARVKTPADDLALTCRSTSRESQGRNHGPGVLVGEAAEVDGRGTRRPRQGRNPPSVRLRRQPIFRCDLQDRWRQDGVRHHPARPLKTRRGAARSSNCRDQTPAMTIYASRSSSSGWEVTPAAI
jgi:hypothetical protein